MYKTIPVSSHREEMWSFLRASYWRTWVRIDIIYLVVSTFFKKSRQAKAHHEVGSVVRKFVYIKRHFYNATIPNKGRMQSVLKSQFRPGKIQLVLSFYSVFWLLCLSCTSNYSGEKAFWQLYEMIGSERH